MSIEIPLKNKANEVLEIVLEELPSDAAQIISILREEEVPLDLWLRFAVEYHRRGLSDAFQEILLAALSPEMATCPARPIDRIAILNALAAHHIALASKEKDKNTRLEHFLNATSKLNEADRIQPEDLTIVGKGVLLLTKRDIGNAHLQFDTVLRQRPDHVPALIGKACVSFHEGRYKEALQLYLKAMKTLPSQAVFRLGAALAYHKLNELTLARKAYERVLQLDFKNVDAMAGLAVICISSQDEEEVREGLGLLKRAYLLDRTHPLVLVSLARHMSDKEEHSKALKLASAALQHTEAEGLKAEAHLLVAKAHHASEDFDLAYQHYLQASNLDSSLLQAWFGLAQMQLFRGNRDQAKQALEMILKKEPQHLETLKMLGSLLCQEKESAQVERGKQYLQAVLKESPEDIETWMQLGEVFERLDTAAALSHYERAASIWKEHVKAPLPFELLNNIAALHFQRGSYHPALESFELAATLCREHLQSSPDPTDKEHAALVTLRFNQARTMEELHQDEEAKKIYQELLADFPGYIDCYLRLGSIALKKQNFDQAKDWFDEVLGVDQDSPNAWSMMGHLHMLKNEWKPCRKKFERILTKTDKHDLYSLVTLGNIHLRTAKFEQSRQQVDECYRRGMEHYCKALSLDPHNLFAANGIAVVLADRGHFGLAKEILIKIREASAEIPDAWINLAHIYSELRMYPNAIKLYESSLKKFYDNRDVPILIYIARAYYLYGKETKDFDLVSKSLRALQKALHIRPWDQSIRFNIALTLQESSFVILRKSTAERTLAQVTLALNQITQAHLLFHRLSKVEPYPRNSYDPKMAGERANYCASLINMAKKHMEIQQREDKGKEAKFLDAEKSRNEKLELERRQAEEERLAKEAGERDIERKRREMNEQALKALTIPLEEQKPKKRKGAASGSESEGSNDERPREKKRRRKSGKEGEKKRKKRRHSGSREQTPVSGGSDEEQEEESSGEEETERERKKRKKKEKRETKQRRKQKADKGKERDHSDEGDDDSDDTKHRRGLDAFKSRRSREESSRKGAKRKERGMSDTIDSEDEDAADAEAAPARAQRSKAPSDSEGEEGEEEAQERATPSSKGRTIVDEDDDDE